MCWNGRLANWFLTIDFDVWWHLIWKNSQIAATSDYGFVEFESHAAAERALQRAAAGMRLEEKELKVNWANSSPSHPNHSGGHSHNSHGNHNANRDHALGKVGANGTSKFSEFFFFRQIFALALVPTTASVPLVTNSDYIIL